MRLRRVTMMFPLDPDAQNELRGILRSTAAQAQHVTYSSRPSLGAPEQITNGRNCEHLPARKRVAAMKFTAPRQSRDAKKLQWCRHASRATRRRVERVPTALPCRVSPLAFREQ